MAEALTDRLDLSGASAIQPLALYPSCSVGGQDWMVFRFLHGPKIGTLGCTCRGFAVSKAGACTHTKTEVTVLP